MNRIGYTCLNALQENLIKNISLSFHFVLIVIGLLQQDNKLVWGIWTV